MKKFAVYLIISLLVFGCKINQEDTTEKSALIEVFKASNTDLPEISVHRGGKGISNYPENCLETLKYMNDSIRAIFEIDVAQTKDGKLVLMHDNSIDRTTTGTGLVRNLTYSHILKYNLMDDFGKETSFKVPLFEDILKWSKANNVVLTVDIKRSVAQKDVIEAIRKESSEDQCIIITYDVSQAKSAYESAPDLMLSVSARNQKELDRLLEAKIPTENMIAFTGTRLSHVSLYERLHSLDVVCILGTLGNLDGQAEARGDQLYKKWRSKGVDMLATDRPFEAYNALNNKDE